MEEQKGKNQENKSPAPLQKRSPAGPARRPAFGGAPRHPGQPPRTGGAGFGNRGRAGGRTAGPAGAGRGRGIGGGDRRGGRAPFRREGDRERDPFNEQVLDLRRVTRVVAGGKRFRFRATVVIGDGHGKVGVGVAKGADVQSAVSKAKSAAKKKIVSFKIIEGTIPHEVKSKFSAAEVIIRPAKAGHGLMAGGAVRSVLLLAGVKDVTAKCLGGTKNKLTNAMATVAALRQFKPVK